LKTLLIGFFSKAIPWANVLAGVATKQPPIQIRSNVNGDLDIRLGLDGPVRNALRAIDNVWFDDGLCRAYINACRAGAAVVCNWF
jgi:hypothetical protein